MAILRGKKYLEDSEPAYRGVSKTTPVAPKPVVAAPVAAPVAPFNFAGLNLAGLASLAAKPAAAPAVVAPAPVAPRFDPGMLASLAAKYAPAAPATTQAIQAAIAPPVAAPPPIVAPAPTPAGIPTEYSAKPINIDLAKYGLTQQDVARESLVSSYTAPPVAAPAPVIPKFDPGLLASLAAKYAPAAPATTQAIQAAIAPPPPPPVAAPAAPAAVPTIQEYLKQKQEAFKPVETGGGSGLSAKTYSSYDPAADVAEYKRLYGAQANPWDIAVAETPGQLIGFSGGLGGTPTYSTTSREELQNAYLRGEGAVKPSDAYTAALDPQFKTRLNLRDQLLAQGSQYGVNYKGKAQNAAGNAAEMARLLEAGGITDLSQLKVVDGKLVNSVTGKPFENKYTDRKDRFGYSALGSGQTDYKYTVDANGNPVFYPQWRSSSTNLGFVGKIAPIVGGVLAGPLGAAIASGATSAIQGGNIGDIIKSAGTSYLGGQVGGYAGDLAQGATQSLSPGISGALTGAATGGASAAATGALRGDLNLKNIATGALTGGAVGGINDLISTYLPAKGELQDQIRSPGSTAAPVSGSTFVDNVLRNAAVRAPGTLMGGGNLQDILVGSVAGEAGKTAAGYLPSTGIDFIDRLAGGITQGTVQTGLKDILGGSPSAPTRAPSQETVAAAPAPAPAPTETPAQAPAPAPAPAPVVAEEKSPDLMPMLLAMGLMGNEPAQQAPAQQSVGPMNLADLSWLYSSQQQQKKPQSVEELLKSLQGYA